MIFYLLVIPSLSGYNVIIIMFFILIKAVNGLGPSLKELITPIENLGLERTQARVMDK